MRHNHKGFTISELVIVFVIVLIIGALMLPFIKYTRAKMEKTLCANNLRQIGLALYIYAREHGGTFPDKLQILYEQQYLADEQLMDCPAGKNSGTIESPDYVYIPGFAVRDLSSEPLVYDKEGNHPNGGNVLYVNADIGWEKGATKNRKCFPTSAGSEIGIR